MRSTLPAKSRSAAAATSLPVAAAASALAEAEAESSLEESERLPRDAAAAPLSPASFPEAAAEELDEEEEEVTTAAAEVAPSLYTTAPLRLCWQSHASVRADTARAGSPGREARTVRMRGGAPGRSALFRARTTGNLCREKGDVQG
jgi:hypothetical protein